MSIFHLHRRDSEHGAENLEIDGNCKAQHAEAAKINRTEICISEGSDPSRGRAIVNTPMACIKVAPTWLSWEREASDALCRGFGRTYTSFVTENSTFVTGCLSPTTFVTGSYHFRYRDQSLQAFGQWNVPTCVPIL